MSYFQENGTSILEFIPENENEEPIYISSQLNGEFDFNTINVYFKINQVDMVQKMIDIFCPAASVKQKGAQKSKIKLLYKKGQQLYFKDFNLKKINVDIDLNYGSDFPEIHKRYKNLLETTMTGIYIMEGPPGTGKTSYIKYLTSQVDRPFYYIPSNYVEFLDKPEFFTMLCEENESNPIIVLEDADKAILKRDTDNMSLVSSILNISDGVLSDILNLSFIITYNMDHQKVDEALTRKGRCRLKYNFGELNISDAQKKVDSLGIDYKVKEKMSLANIYNLLSDNGVKKQEERKIGFGV